MSKFWYLASPYTKYDEGLRAAYECAVGNAAFLMTYGVNVYAPIIHTHPVWEVSPCLQEWTHQCWIDDSRPKMESACGIIVLQMAGWDVSSGVSQEIEIFRSAGKPIVYMKPYIVPEEVLSQVKFDRLNRKGQPVFSDEGQPLDVGGPTLQSVLPAEDSVRKESPIVSGVLDYFPLAIAEVARTSYNATKQHHPNLPMHWDRSKANDHADCIARHLIDRGARDVDGGRHTAKLAWRALALLQQELEDEGGKPGRASRNYATTKIAIKE